MTKAQYNERATAALKTALDSLEGGDSVRAAFRVAIDGGADMGVEDKYGWTALMVAVQFLDTTTVEKVAKAKGVERTIDAATSSGDWNALIYAVVYGNEGKVRAVLSVNGAIGIINKMDTYGQTP